jgi:hypothetical protein
LKSLTISDQESCTVIPSIRLSKFPVW